MSSAEYWAATPREIDERRTVYNREYYGPAALICSLIANVNRDPQKRADPFVAEDFLPTSEPRKQPGMTKEQWIAMAKAWKAALGG